MTHRGIGNKTPEVTRGIGSPFNRVIKGIGGGLPDAFIPVEDRIFQFKINSGPVKLFQLPLYNGGDYDFTVLDWGDTDTDDITAWNDAAVTHMYPLADTDYIITIQGKLKGFNFDLAPTGAANKDKILDVEKAGCLQLLSGGASFFDCSNLEWSAVDEIPNLPTDMRWTWEACVSMTKCASANASDWSGVLLIEGIYDSCILLNQLFNLNTEFCTNFRWAFFGLSSQDKLITLNYSQADIVEGMLEESILYDHPIVFSTAGTVKITNANFFLYGATAYNSDVTGWEFFDSLLQARGFYQLSGIDRPLSIDLSNVDPGLDLRDFIRDTDFDDTLIIEFQKVDRADNFATGNFSLSVANWSNFIIDVQSQSPDLQDDVIIHAEPKHTSAAGDAIDDLTGDHDWTVNDDGEVP